MAEHDVDGIDTMIEIKISYDTDPDLAWRTPGSKRAVADRRTEALHR
jgi:hypothetical protein